MSLIRSPRRWRRISPPTSVKPRPTGRRRGVPRKQHLRSAFVRRLVGGRARDHPRIAEPGEPPPQAARPRGVHRPCSDRADRLGAAAPDRAAQGVSRRYRNSTTASSRATTVLLRIARPRPAGHREYAGLRAGRLVLLCFAIVALGFAAWLWSRWSRSAHPGPGLAVPLPLVSRFSRWASWCRKPSTW